MNRFVVFIAFLCVCLSGRSQTDKNWELEPYVGMTIPFRSIGSMDAKVGPAFGLEYRHSVGNGGFWIGGEAGVQGTGLVFPSAEDVASVSEYHFRTGYVCFVGELRFEEIRKMQFFVGVSVGIGQCLSDNLDLAPEHVFRPIIKPRVGIQCWRHLRVGIDALVTHRNFNSVNIRLGYAF